jgi:hypothetical protein
MSNGPTRSGRSVLLIACATYGLTVVVAVAELLPGFRSLVLLDIVAVFVMTVPSFALDLTVTTIVKVAEPAFLFHRPHSALL